MDFKDIFQLLLLLFFSLPNNLQQSQPIQNDFPNPIESGFIFSGDYTFYGLNIDTTPSEIRFNFIKSGGLHILLIQTEIYGQNFILSGVNNYGNFIAGQIFNTDSLNSTTIDQQNQLILDFIQEEKIPNINNWLNKQDKLQLLNGEKFIFNSSSTNGLIEIINNEVNIYSTEDDFEVLLPLPYNNYKNYQVLGDNPQVNFSILDFLNFEINENINSPLIETHLSMAHKVKLNPENSATILISPNKNYIFITLNNDINKIWLIDLNGGTIETYSGFNQLHKGNIPQIGITSKDLSILNFSNETLMKGIIFEAALILIVIGLTIFFILRNFRIQKI